MLALLNILTQQSQHIWVHVLAFCQSTPPSPDCSPTSNSA